MEGEGTGALPRTCGFTPQVQPLAAAGTTAGGGWRASPLLYEVVITGREVRPLPPPLTSGFTPRRGGGNFRQNLSE